MVLNVLNVVLTKDFKLHKRWGDACVQSLCPVVDYQKGDFRTFHQIKRKVQT